MTSQGSQSVLILGRAMHPPWNEGNRMIARNLAEAAGDLRPTRVLSLTRPIFDTGEQDAAAPIEHVRSRLGYGAASDWLSLPGVVARGRRVVAGAGVGVAHIVSLPLALAPWLRARGPRIVVHVTLSEHVYATRLERMRAAAGWRLFDPWIDAYAATSPWVWEALAQQGLSERKLHVVPPPLSLDTFKPVDRAAARASLGIAPDAFSVAYMGTVSPLRFPAEMIVRALEEAGPRTPGLRLDVFAPVRTHEYNLEFAGGHLASAARGSAVPVHIHLQDLDDGGKTEVFSAADLVILPFAAAVAVEPPLTLLEAMACEAVVAVSPAANRSRIVRHEETGLTFEDAPSLAACIAAAAERGEAARRVLGAAARLDIAASHGMERVGRSLAEVWQAVGR